MSYSRKFRYEATDLIRLIEARPPLWHKYRDDFKNKLKKEECWREVHRALEPQYDSLNEEEKTLLADTVTEKWKNLRDAFARSLKKKSGQPYSKKYIYHDNLHFLHQFIDKDPLSGSDDPFIDFKHEEYEITSPSGHKRVHEAAVEVDFASKLKRSRLVEPAFEDVVEPEAASNKSHEFHQSAYELDDNEAFFASLMPAVRGLSEDEKIEFRMGSLALIQKIKSKRSACTSECSSTTKHNRAS